MVLGSVLHLYFITVLTMYLLVGEKKPQKNKQEKNRNNLQR